MRYPFGPKQQHANGQIQPSVPRLIPRAPQLPMTLPEQLHPTTHALAQLDAALQEVRRLEGHIEGLDTIIDDLRAQLKESRRDREMYRGYTTEIRAHLGYLMDGARKAHSAAMAAAEAAAVTENEQSPAAPQDLDAATADLEAQLRKVTAEVNATEQPATEEQK